MGYSVTHQVADGHSGRAFELIAIPHWIGDSFEWKRQAMERLGVYRVSLAIASDRIQHRDVDDTERWLCGDSSFLERCRVVARSKRLNAQWR